MDPQEYNEIMRTLKAIQDSVQASIREYRHEQIPLQMETALLVVVPQDELPVSLSCDSWAWL